MLYNTKKNLIILTDFVRRVKDLLGLSLLRLISRLLRGQGRLLLYIIRDVSI
jgi:hypothetical protein